MNITDSFNKQFQQKVLETIRAYRLIEEGEGVLTGVSGGPDSVCLLHVLHSLKGILGIDLYAIHINHMLRGEEAREDEKYAEGLCKELGIICSAVHVNVALLAEKSGMSLEEAGREARYKEFDRYSKLVGAAKIAVAHNRNDQAETVMMHIIRGSGTSGLVGMEYKRGNIIRPLLGISRKEIEYYCKEAGLLPRTDSTNLKEDFTRNKIRLGLFPYINKQFGVNITESLCRLSENAAEDNSFLDKCAREAYESAVTLKDAGRVELNLDCLRETDPAICIRVMKMVLNDVAGSSNGIGSVHYRMLQDTISRGVTGTRTELPNGIRADVSYGVLKIYVSGLNDKENRQTNVISFSRDIKIPGVTQVSELDAKVSASVETAVCIAKSKALGYNPFVQYFDYDKLKKGINIRNRQNGDIFKPFRSNGTKKLKEYFIDSKIPREQRDMIPLVCLDKEVIWIIGHKISDKFKVTENTKSILKLEYSRRN